jgi:hypothetical protein
MSAPEFPRRVSVAEVVHNTRCELYEAVRDNVRAHPWLEQWAATFAFSFKVERDLNASTDTTYLIPVQYGTFSLEITGALNQSAQGTASQWRDWTAALASATRLNLASRLRAA